MNEENFDIVAAVKQLVEDYGHLANEIAEVKQSIYDNLINPVKEEFEQMQYENQLSDFRCKYAEKLEPFSDKLKKLEHDEDFDVVKNAFDDFSNRTDGMPEEEYVDKLAASIQSQLDEIASVFGVEPEKIEEVKVETTEGDEVKAEVEDGEVVAVENETETEITEDEVKDEVKDNADVEEKAEAEDEPVDDEVKDEVKEEITDVEGEEKEETEEETTAKKINKMLGIE